MNIFELADDFEDKVMIPINNFALLLLAYFYVELL